MPKLIIVRHAQTPEPDEKTWPDDATRPLRKKGVKRFKKAAAGLGELVKPDVVLTSPAARCIQTAGLLTWDGAWPDAVASDVLDDGHSPTEVINAIRALPNWPCTVAIVGHGPNLVELLSHLVLGYGDTGTDIDKGGAAQVEVKNKMKAGTGKLDWFMGQKELKSHRKV